MLFGLRLPAYKKTMVFSCLVFSLTLFLTSSWSPTDLQSHVNSVKIKSFPELSSIRVSLEEVNLKKSFFATDVKNLFKFWMDRDYVIRFHPSILNSKISAESLDAILARELSLIAMYIKMSNFELVVLALRYHFGSNKFQADFERETDVRTVERGYREGLKSYREWIYTQLSKEEVGEKKKLFMTLDELDNP